MRARAHTPNKTSGPSRQAGSRRHICKINGKPTEGGVLQPLLRCVEQTGRHVVCRRLQVNNKLNSEAASSQNKTREEKVWERRADRGRCFRSARNERSENETGRLRPAAEQPSWSSLIRVADAEGGVYGCLTRMRNLAY